MKNTIKVIAEFKDQDIQSHMESLPVGYPITIITSRNRKEGIEFRTEYKKISTTHVEKIRSYEYS